MAPLTRRRSARLASNSKPSGGAAAPSLDSLAEQHEVPEEQASSPVLLPPRTPAGSSPVKPSMSEMRPGKANVPKAPPSSALRLGFADIDSARQESPSAKRSPLSAISPFTFRFSRKNDKVSSDAAASEVTASARKAGRQTPDLGLSDEARRMMEELREEAQKIRADLEVQREQEKAQAEEEAESGANGGRKIAMPKSRANRFSAAHTAQFSKMDSIANHPSAFRAARFTPVKSTAVPAATPVISSQARGLKRTQSKANLDDTPNKSSRTPAVPASASMSTTKKHYNPLFGNSTSSSHIVLGGDSKPPQSVREGNLLFQSSDEQPLSAAKRIKQHLGDDASSSRPMSRDGSALSALPRPASLTNSVSSLSRSNTTASLLTPTKPPLARSTSIKTPGTSDLQPKTPGKTPSKVTSKTPSQLFSALKKSATMSSLQASVRTPPPAEAEKGSRPRPPPSRAEVQKVHKTATALSTANVPSVANTTAARSALPVPMAAAVMAFSKTPAPPRLADMQLPRLPATTPCRKLIKRVAFTPVTQRAILSAKSPSLVRSGLPRSALKSRPARDSDMEIDTDDMDSAAAKDSPSIRRRFGATVFYPDLSGHELLGGSSSSSKAESSETAIVFSPSAKLAPPPPSVPGTFTFRSDKTISFGQKSPTGFGSSPGQASIRQVRSLASMMPKIPGSFPGSSHAGDMFTALVATDGPNKENTRPVAVNVIPHGIANKKRSRVSEADEEAEQQAADRAAKKRKNEPVPEGEALLAPRLVGKTISSASRAGSVRSTPQKMMPQKQPTFSGTAGGKTPGSTTKKRPVLSLSRLNSLARPKLRK